VDTSVEDIVPAKLRTFLNGDRNLYVLLPKYINGSSGMVQAQPEAAPLADCKPFAYHWRDDFPEDLCRKRGGRSFFPLPKTKT
jgi:hypothetical protein